MRAMFPPTPFLNFPTFSHLRLAVACGASIVLSSGKRDHISALSSPSTLAWRQLRKHRTGFPGPKMTAGLTQVVTYDPVQCLPGPSRLFSLLGLSRVKIS